VSNADLTRAFLHSFETRDGSNASYYAADVIQREFPNAFTKAGATRNREALLRGMEAGKRSTSGERYEIVKLVAEGDEVAVEAIWTATLNVAVGSLAAGHTMRAYLAIFLTWREGKIIAQRNYDCFEPF
jgi:ketosteroid isomerase-like protein